ncbi:MAG TPA: tetratricopeptide repeat protein, partial [Gemmataceae bacterium]|nr:tetratricopeptide repeat protein [Gemmataceae bacterium]
RATQASRARQRPEEPTVIHTARSGSGSETVAGSVMGTPGFMSPEQAGGEIDKLDERADVFGLGAVLCVILTGNPPYVANTADAVRLMAVRGQLADAFGRLDGCGAGPDLIGLCKRCLSADRDSRPRHAGEVAGAMAAHLAGVEDRVRQAQVERAAAETRTAEERKRRRVQLALAVSLLTLVGVAGGALLLVQKQRSDRAQAEADLDRQELVARREAAVRAERSRVGVEQALAQLPELYRRGLWDHADATLEKTETFLGPDADPEVQARVARAKRDTLILRRLDQIRLRFGEQFDAAAAAREYAEALRDAGFGEFRMGPRELADRLREHPYSEHLLAAAAALLNHTPRPDERLYWDAVLDAVYPPNTFYGQWRRANRSPDPKEVLRLVERVEYDRLTPTTIWLMSLNLHFRQPPEAEAAARLLRAGLDYYPSDFWLHYELCTVSLRRMNPPRLDVAIRHGTAAVALRPRIARAHYELAYGLYRHGDLSRAEAECREAVHLDPGFVWSHFDLASVLRAKGDLDGALAAGREAVSVDPTNPSTYIGLGWTLEARGDRVGAVEAYRNAVRVGPKHAPAHDNLGIALRATGDWDGAIAAFRESARVDPKSKFPFVQLRQTEEWRSLAPQLDAVKSGQKVSNPNKMVQLATLAAARMSVQQVTSWSGGNGGPI